MVQPNWNLMLHQAVLYNTIVLQSPPKAALLVRTHPPCRDNRKYRATIFKGNKPCHIGYFRDPVEAAKAYDREAIKTRGPHTATNFDVSKYMVSALVRLE